MLKAVNLSKTYSGTPAVKNLNLTVESGEIFCLLGQNDNDFYQPRRATKCKRAFARTAQKMSPACGNEINQMM